MSEEKRFLDRAETLNDDALEQVAGGRTVFCPECEGACHCGYMDRKTYYGCNVKCTGCGGNVYQLVGNGSKSHLDGICRDCGTRMGYVARMDLKDCWRV